MSTGQGIAAAAAGAGAAVPTSAVVHDAHLNLEGSLTITGRLEFHFLQYLWC